MDGKHTRVRGEARNEERQSNQGGVHDFKISRFTLTILMLGSVGHTLS